jgi:hypothetical protein
MSKILNILEGEDKDFRYYSAKGHASTPLEFGQKSIPYGMDEQGGGSSKQPYIESSQPKLSFSIEQLTNSLVDISKAESAVVDVARMTKWFTTPLSNGILFNAKQVHQASLQEKNYQYSIGADLAPNPQKVKTTALGNLVSDIGTGATNTGHILRQVGGNALNLHFTNPLIDKFRIVEFNPGQTGNVAGNGFENKEVQGRSNYGKFNRTQTYKQGNPGQPRLNRTDPFGEGITTDNKPTTSDASNAPTVDKVTFTPLHKSGVSKNKIRLLDTVPFYITVIDNDNQNDNVHIHFRAFIDSFNDAFAADWQAHRFMGRGDSFYTYQGENRSINTSFKVHAQSKQELIPMYNKLNYLASSVSPDYSQGGFMRGNFIQLTIGDYMVDVPGILNSFTLDIPTNYPWDIGRNKDGKKESAALPMIINVSSFQFTPIYNFIPRKLNIDDEGNIVGDKFINNKTITPTLTEEEKIANDPFAQNYFANQDDNTLPDTVIHTPDQR